MHLEVLKALAPKYLVPQQTQFPNRKKEVSNTTMKETSQVGICRPQWNSRARVTNRSRVEGRGEGVGGWTTCYNPAGSATM